MLLRRPQLDLVDLVPKPSTKPPSGCGRRDEHALHFGALQLHRRLEAAGVPHEYQEFDDGHRNTSYRLDTSLPLLYQALR